MEAMFWNGPQSAYPRFAFISGLDLSLIKQGGNVLEGGPSFFFFFNTLLEGEGPGAQA